MLVYVCTRHSSAVNVMIVSTDGGSLKECQCTLIKTLYNYCPSSHAKPCEDEACATVRDPLAREAPCSTSTPGP